MGPVVNYCDGGDADKDDRDSGDVGGILKAMMSSLAALALLGNSLVDDPSLYSVITNQIVMRSMKCKHHMR